MLEVKQLEVHYSGIKALRGLSLEVRKGETVTLIGPNGAGKSTLINAISGIVAPSAGQILDEGRDISRENAWNISRSGILQVPEGRQVFGDLTVIENLQLGATALRDRDASYSIDGVFTLFPILAERRVQRAGSLSGGQQQMLAIGRALMGAPRLLLLDEPSLGLAPVIIAQVFEALRVLREQGMTILLVEQNAQLALAVSDRAYIIDQGRIGHSARSADLLLNQDIVSHYLGNRVER